MLSRRQLLKTGMAGSVVLLAAGWLATPREDAAPEGVPAFKALQERDAVVLRAIIPVMLGLPQVPVDEVLKGVDASVAALPPPVRDELRQLFDLLDNRWARRWLAGVREPWAEASPAALARFLANWRDSAFPLWRSAYQALHALINAGWYGNAASWSAIGYAQPAQVMGLLP